MLISSGDLALAVFLQILLMCNSLSLFFFSRSRRAHTVTVLFILTCALVYVTLLEETPQDTAYNTKRSVGSVCHFLNVPAGSSRQAKKTPLHSPQRFDWTE